MEVQQGNRTCNHSLKREKPARCAGIPFEPLNEYCLAFKRMPLGSGEALASIVEAAALAHGNSMQSYLTMMAVRLLEMRRVLKPTGSIYLHCDPTASHYLKLIMDCVSGRDRFRNEISWKRTSSHSSAKRFAPVHDTLLFYASGSATWHPQYLPLSEKYLARDYRHADGKGRYRVGDLTGSGLRDGESGEPWGGYDPSRSGRHWGVPSNGAYAQWIEDNLIPGYKSIPGVHAHLDALSDAGLIDWTSKGYPRLKRYLAASKGEAVSDFIGDIQNVNNRSKEYVAIRPRSRWLCWTGSSGLARTMAMSCSIRSAAAQLRWYPPKCWVASGSALTCRIWPSISSCRDLKRPLTKARCSKAGNCRTSTTERTSPSARM